MHREKRHSHNRRLHSSIFSANGYYSQTAIPPNRPKIEKPLTEMTKEELIARFQGVVARRGTYKIEGNKLTRRDMANTTPNLEGTDQVQVFRIEGDVLILGNTDPADKALDAMSAF